MQALVCVDFILIIVALLQAKALITRLTEEKSNAIQQTNKLRQELVRVYKIYIVVNYYLSIWLNKTYLSILLLFIQEKKKRNTDQSDKNTKNIFSKFESLSWAM